MMAASNASPASPTPAFPSSCAPGVAALAQAGTGRASSVKSLVPPPKSPIRTSSSWSRRRAYSNAAATGSSSKRTFESPAAAAAASSRATAKASSSGSVGAREPNGAAEDVGRSSAPSCSVALGDEPLEHRGDERLERVPPTEHFGRLERAAAEKRLERLNQPA